MSKSLDEVSLLAEFKDLIDDYGRDITFYQTDEETAYDAVKMTPPVREIVMNNDNIPVESKVGVVSASGLAFTPFNGQRMNDSINSLDYRVTQVQPLESGDLIQAYKITFQR